MTQNPEGKSCLKYKSYLWQKREGQDDWNAYLDRVGCWEVTIVGMWFDDSAPEGHGHTEEEARAKALEGLQFMYAEIGQFLQEQGATFTNVLLTEPDLGSFEKFDVNGIPAVFLYDPSGKEIRRFTMDDPNNQFTYDEVEEVVATLLKGEPLPDDAPGFVYEEEDAEQ